MCEFSQQVKFWIEIQPWKPRKLKSYNPDEIKNSAYWSLVKQLI